MVAVGDLAKDRLQSLREYVARQSGADAAVAGWDLISTALNLLIDMSEAVEATGDSYGFIRGYYQWGCRASGLVCRMALPLTEGSEQRMFAPPS